MFVVTKKDKSVEMEIVIDRFHIETRHRGMVGPTVVYTFMCIHLIIILIFTTLIQCWPNMVMPTFEISDIGPM